LVSVANVKSCLLIGVTGGIASGKSTVVAILKDMGAAVIDFDMLAREVVEPGKPAHQEIVAFFGDQVLGPDKQLDRKKIADIVFADDKKRRKLESLTHPAISAAYLERLNAITANDPETIILADIPLLFEGNLQHMFHKTLLVYTPAPLQVKRLMARDGISQFEAESRLKAQMDIDCKIDLADYVIRNENSLEDTHAQTKEIWQTFKLIQKEGPPKQ
jgi:dephospho-CoA kinase